jgi:hypothetical protein
MAIRHSTPADSSFSPQGRAAWDADHEGDASDLTFVQSGSGAVSRTAQAKMRDVVCVLDFIPVAEHAAILAGTSTTDVSSYIQAAFDSITAGEVLAPRGTYKIVSGFSIGQRKSLRGEGQQATVFSFSPTVDNTPCIWVKNGASVANQNNLSGFSISGGGTKIKIGIRLDDTSMCNVENIAITLFADGTSPGPGNIGIQLRGREFTTISRCEIGYCDKPISIEANVNGGIIDCDHLHIRDLYSLSTSGNYHITANTGISLSNFVMDGTNAIVAGDGVFYWNDTTGAAAALNVSFSGIRAESQNDATKYLFYINRTGAFTYGLQLNNVYGGLVARGWYLRKVGDVSFINTNYVNTSNAEALNVDASVWRMSMLGARWQSGTTATLTGQRLLFGSVPVSGPLIDFGFYETTGAEANFGKIQTTALSGDSTVGRIVRQSDLKIEPGTNATTIKCTLTNVWNGDTIAVTDNIGLGTTVGNFSLDGSGQVLKILNAGITGTPIAVLDTTFRNLTGTALFWPQAYISGSDIAFNVKSDHAGTGQNLTGLAGSSFTAITYVTSA